MKENNQTTNPLSLPADLSDEIVREVKATARGLTLKQYETLLRHIGVDYQK